MADAKGTTGSGYNRFKVDVPRLIHTLAGHLYTEPEVAIRELVANARDALVKRCAQESGRDLGIWVRFEQGTEQLSVRDNGVGMTENEISQYLSTIAASGTGEARAGEAPRDLDTAMSGLFGLGFYAALVWADRVEVFTRHSGEPLYHWTCVQLEAEPAGEGEVGWRLEEAAPEAADWPGPGTEVRLYLRGGRHSALASEEKLRALLQRYAALVEFPIRVGNDPWPVNPVVPWREEGAAQQDYTAFLVQRGLLSRREDLISVWPVKERDLEGLLWVTPSSEGKVELHARHILVGPLDGCGVGEDLPFVHGLIDAMEIDLALSREAPLDNEKLSRLRQRLQAAVVEHLGWLAAARPGDFQRLIALHETGLKRACLKDDTLLTVIGGRLRFTVGAAHEVMYLEDIAKRARAAGCLRYADRPELAPYVSIWDSRKVPVVSVDNRLDHAVVWQYALANGLDFERADTGLGEVTQARGEPDWAEVEQLFAGLDSALRPRAAALRATDPPLVFERGAVDPIVDLLEGVSGLPEELAGLREQLGALQPGATIRPVWINTAHAAMQDLRRAVRRGADLERTRAAAQGLLAATRLYGERLQPGERHDALQQITGMISALLGAQGDEDRG